MDLALLQELKQKLLHEKQFSGVWSFFLDQFGENPDFIALGERIDHPLIEAVLAEVGQQMFSQTEKLSRVLLTCLSEQQFVHGGFMIGGRPGGVIYFEDAQMGLIVVADLPPSIETRYARFSGQPLQRQAKPSLN